MYPSVLSSDEPTLKGPSSDVFIGLSELLLNGREVVKGNRLEVAKTLGWLI